MSLIMNLYYTGENGNARKFAEEMENSGIAEAVRAEEGNLKYEYFIPMSDPETVLLIDSWENQEALDAHHASPLMEEIAALREKYDLDMCAERYILAVDPGHYDRYMRKKTSQFENFVKSQNKF